MAIIHSLQNKRAKEWATLLSKKGRQQTGLYLAEGIHMVLEAAGSGLQTIVYDEQRGIPPELAGLAAQASNERQAGDVPALEWIAASPAVMAKCTDTDSPPPCFGVVAKQQLAAGDLAAHGSLVIVLDGVRDPGNVGTIIRSADAAGADAVVLGRGCADPYSPKTVRSTMGSIFHIPVVEADLLELLPQAKRAGKPILGTSLDGAIECYEANLRADAWLVLGSEGDGLSPAVLELVDQALLIPMKGQAESLNVAMAATILLFEALRQRR